MAGSQSSVPVLPPTKLEKGQVIGIYGVSGSGKTFLLNLLKSRLKKRHFIFFEGSDLIASTIPGGLEHFQTLGEEEKAHWRRLAIKNAAHEGAADEKTVVIAGHYMFWKEGEDFGTPVMTQDDLQTYTYILYLEVPATTIVERRQHDIQRNRPQESISHLKRWQETEKTELRRLCYENGIRFSVVADGPELGDQVFRLMCHLDQFTEPDSLRIALHDFNDDIFVKTNFEDWKTLLVLDADKTLTATDTGEVFWEKVTEMWPSRIPGNPLKDIFKSNLQYSHTAFVQAMLVCEEVLTDHEFDLVCKVVADATTMYPEFISLLQAVADQDHIGVVVVTCGLRRVWVEVLQREGLSQTVVVIGGGRLQDRYVVTGDVKTALVSNAKFTHKAYVYAFGDSPLDLAMLKEADQAIVVVGEEQSRSKSMENALLNAIEKDNLRACQVLLPNTAKPRLNPSQLPIVQLTGFDFTRNILRLESVQSPSLEVTHATNKSAALLLMTPMRDARISGPALREAHRLVGHYLATEYLPDACGLKEYMIPHVQGHQIPGYRILHEEKTLIVPLMRGGEPMALGVNDALPHAMFLHASRPEDIHHEHVHGRLNVILVDSVVNSGKTLLEFVRRIRWIHSTIRIVAMIGVIQREALSKIERTNHCRLNCKLIALRISDNKFKGKGMTDTGNRLFNTTHLDD